MQHRAPPPAMLRLLLSSVSPLRLLLRRAAGLADPLAGGHADCSVKVAALESARVLESTTAVHNATVVCLALSPDGATLVTGASDGLLLLWRVQGPEAAAPGAPGAAPVASAGAGTGSSTTSVGPHDASLAAAAAAADSQGSSAAAAGAVAVVPPPAAASSGLGNALRADSVAPGQAALPGGLDSLGDMPLRRWRRVEGPVKVLAGQGSDLVCCCVSSELDVVASVSRSRGLVLHSIMGGRVLLCLPRLRCADIVALSPEGLVVLWTRRQRLLRVLTINGTHVAAVRVPEEDGDVSALCVSRDGTHLALGTDCSRWRQRREKQRERERIMAAAAAGRSTGGLLRARPKERPAASAQEQASAEAPEAEERLKLWDLWDSLASAGGGGHVAPLPGRAEEPREWRESDEGVSQHERGAAVSLLDIYTLKASHATQRASALALPCTSHEAHHRPERHGALLRAGCLLLDSGCALLNSGCVCRPSSAFRCRRTRTSQPWHSPQTILILSAPPRSPRLWDSSFS